MTASAQGHRGRHAKETERSKNFFALGLMSWMYGRPIDATLALHRDAVRQASRAGRSEPRAFKAGYNYGETTEVFAVALPGAAGQLAPGMYRNITGNEAIALGLVAAEQAGRLPLFLGATRSRPRRRSCTSSSSYKHFGVSTFQAEDEIAAIGAALGASFGGARRAPRRPARASR